MFERFTDRARRVVVLAQEEARMLNHPHVGTEHLLLGLIHEGEGVAAKALTGLGIDLEGLRRQVEEIIGQGEQPPSGHIPFTPRAKKALELSLRESSALGHGHVGTEHLLLGLIRENEGVAAQALVEAGGGLDRVREQLVQLVETRPQEPESSAVLPGKFGRDLTNEAGLGRLDPVLGRSAEFERMFQVLLRRGKNNPVLVGEPGIDKLAVAGGFAMRAWQDPVPSTLIGTSVFALAPHIFGEDLAELVEHIKARSGTLIVFIDDIHTWGLDPLPPLAGALMPLVARGQLQLIGGSTPDDYERHLAKNPALGRYFQPIQVVAPSLQITIETLKRERDRIEAHHRVSITDEALAAAAILAHRYVTDLPLPDSALELLDEAGARLRTSQIAEPPLLAELDHRIAGIREEKERAIDSQDFDEAQRLRDLEKDLLHTRAQEEKRWADGDLVIVVEVDEDVLIEVVAERVDVPVRQLRNLLSPAPAPSPELDAQRTYHLLNDQPVVSTEDDLLGAAGTARGIAAILARASSPFVLAVDGSWGVGKSTLLRQIEAALPGAPDMVKVRFNAWTAQGENALESLIKSVIGKIDPNVLRRWLRRLTKQQKFFRLGFGLLARFFGVSRLIDELWTRLEVNAQTRNEFRTVIHQLLADWVKPGKTGRKRTLVVFIDDLDRCSDASIVKICEAVKLYLDAPGLIFVLGCDLSVLARGVSIRESAGRTYLEKIVQVVHRVPTPDPAGIMTLIRSYAGQAGIADLMDDTVTEIVAERTARNPRRIKRIINSFVLEHHLNPAWRRPPLGSTQLIIVIVLQHLYPEFYERLAGPGHIKDPIGEFLDYATLSNKATDPPGATDTWWSTTSRVFHRYGLNPPERSPASMTELRAGIEHIERLLPAWFPELAFNAPFVAMLREIGDPETRLALRDQLVSRPLGTGTISS